MREKPTDKRPCRETGGGAGVRGWRDTPLGEVADIQTGPFGSQLHASDYVAVGIPSIMPTNIGTRLEINRSNIACIKDADAKRLARYLVKEGDIVYSRRGDVEKCAFIKNNESGWLCGTGCLRIRFVSDKVIPRFCAYLLSTDEMKGWVSGHAVGTTMPNLNSSTMQKLPLALPPLPEQKSIAAVLSSLDDKIDLLHRQNQTLEAMAETLFRQWFIEAAPQPSPQPSPSGRGSEKGARVEYSVADFVTHVRLNVNPAKTGDGLFHHYSIPAFDAGMRPVIEPGNAILSNKYRVTEHSLLVSKLNPREPRVWPVGELPNENSICSTEFQVLKPKDAGLYGYIYNLLRSSQAADALIMAASGTSGSHQRVRPEDILNITTILPSIRLARQYSDIVMPGLHKMRENRRQILTLEKLRDNLLPKLMSGEVRVEV